MAPLPTTGSKANPGETELLGRLLGLYEEEHQVYRRVHELTLHQGEQLRRGVPLGEIRRILEQKKSCLEVIGHLEMTERATKTRWEQGRARWSGQGKARLQAALQEVTDLIEEILAAEEKCDTYLIQQAQVV